MKNIKPNFKYYFIVLFGLSLTSCVTQKKMDAQINKTQLCETDLQKTNNDFMLYKDRMSREQLESSNQIIVITNTLNDREQQIRDLNVQLTDSRNLRDKQLDAVGNLTVLSKEANANIDKTLSQMAEKDRYIYTLHAARTKTDSINLALALNLTSVLRNGIHDKDIDVKVDKTVVMINISDKMLFSSGSSKLSPSANAVLEKIALIVKSRPELEVMVEGYTDNVSISTDCIVDNWDLSAKRATSVVRMMQESFGIDPNKLIAAGRGEYNILASNLTSEGRTKNRWIFRVKMGHLFRVKVSQ
jgi:chemotaxis protein MotB